MRFADYLGSDPLRPFSQAIQTYATLKGVARADEEMKLRREEAEANREQRTWQRGITERQEGRADTELARSGAIHDAAMRKTGREEEAATAENDLRRWRSLSAQAAAGVQLEADDFAFLTGTAKGMPNLERGERFEDYEKAYTNLKEFVGDLYKVPGGQFQIARDPRNPGRENIFRSVLLASGGESRLGAVNDYQAMDPKTGEMRAVKGMVGQPTRILVDRDSQKMGVAFQIVDPETKQPLIGGDGLPLVVPATENRSADPKDRVRLASFEEVAATADEGLATNQSARAQWEKMTPAQKRMVELSRRIQLRDPEAVKEMEGLRKAQTTAKALRTQAMTMEPGADQDALVRQADLLDSGMLIEDAKAIATAAVAPKKKKEDDAAAVKRKGEEAKAEYENKVGPEVKARGQAAIALEKEQQTGRMAVEEAETERAVKVAGIGAASHERVAKLNAAVEMAKESARKSERLDEKGKARLAAQNNLLRVESAVAGQYVRLASDPMSAESRALRATKTDAEREMLKRQYVASDPAVIQALANLEEYGGVPQPKGKEGAIQAVSTHGGKAKADPLGLR
jgi:autonomous glycyl radical cofactor GrcA